VDDVVRRKKGGSVSTSPPWLTALLTKEKRGISTFATAQEWNICCARGVRWLVDAPSTSRSCKQDVAELPLYNRSPRWEL